MTLVRLALRPAAGRGRPAGSSSVGLVLGPPHVAQQVRGRDQPAPRPDERPRTPPTGRGQVDGRRRSVASTCLRPRSTTKSGTHAALRRPALPRSRRAALRTQPGEQLPDPERLGEVVVGSRVEGTHLVRPGRVAPESTTIGTPLVLPRPFLDHAQSRRCRQAEIEHDRHRAVRCGPAPTALGAGGGGMHRVAARAKREDESLASWSSSSTTRRSVTALASVSSRRTVSPPPSVSRSLELMCSWPQQKPRTICEPQAGTAARHARRCRRALPGSVHRPCARARGRGPRRRSRGASPSSVRRDVDRVSPGGSRRSGGALETRFPSITRSSSTGSARASGSVSLTSTGRTRAGRPAPLPRRQRRRASARPGPSPRRPRGGSCRAGW